jgi:NMD protein affecting ribosome stability and mRNA decay
MKTARVPRISFTSSRRRWGRAQESERQDPYALITKPAEPTACPQCGAIYRDGRWQWSPFTTVAHGQLCSACRRINDRQPAGLLTLRGSVLHAKKSEIIQLVRHQEEAEKAEHPLNRIIAIDEQSDAIVVTTTDIHLPRRIGKALRRAYRGELKLAYDEDSYFIRVSWHRNQENRFSQSGGTGV